MIATAFPFSIGDEKRLTDNSALLYEFPPARLFEFVLGMTAGLAFTRIGHVPGGSRLVWTLIEAAAILLVVAEMWLIQSTSTPLGYWLDRVAIAPFAALLLFVMAQGAGYISKAIAFRFRPICIFGEEYRLGPLVFLGEISYSIYLLHFPLAKLYFITHEGILPEWAELAGYLALLFLASAATYWLIENPARRAIQRLAGFASPQPA